MFLSRSGLELNEIWGRQVQGLTESDERSRTLERRYKETGSPEDRHTWARTTLRAGNAREAAEVLHSHHHDHTKEEHETYSRALHHLSESLPHPEAGDHDGHNDVFDALHKHFHHLSDAGRAKLSRSARHIALKLDHEHSGNSEGSGGSHPGSGWLPLPKFHRLGDALSVMNMGHAKFGVTTHAARRANDTAKFLHRSRTPGTTATGGGDAGVSEHRRYNSDDNHYMSYRAHHLNTGSGTSEMTFRQRSPDYMSPAHRTRHGGPAAVRRWWNSDQTIDHSNESHSQKGRLHRDGAEGPAEHLTHHVPEGEGSGSRLKTQKLSYIENDSPWSKKTVTRDHDGDGNLSGQSTT